MKTHGYGRINFKPEETKPLKRRTPEEKEAQLKARRGVEDREMAKQLGITLKELKGE
ncbi:hypothetical protein [Pseudoalteromonas marina]|uniref:hypothetical protein n=1 Tax=Pseudoalteromonas marina TaxID=267375 RepID=UPI003C4418B0